MARVKKWIAKEWTGIEDIVDHMGIILVRAPLVRAQPIHWIQPDSQWIKTNIDGAWKSPGMASIEGTTWDNLGKSSVSMIT